MGPFGPYSIWGASAPIEGGFGSNWGVLPVKRNSVYKELWRKVIDLMGLRSHVNMTFQLVRFWFILVTLVICRHLVLTLSLPLEFSHFFLLEQSVNRPVAVETTEELWPGLLSDVFHRPTAHCAPEAATQVGKNSSSLFLP